MLSDAGQPIAFAAGDTRIEITGDGSVRTENGAVGKLRIVRFDSDQALKAEGDRRFAADTPPLPWPRRRSCRARWKAATSARCSR